MAAADESANGETSAHAYLAISCLGAPGPGAWAILFDQNGEQRVMTGGHPRTNAARLDLLAAIAALEAVSEGEAVRIFTVSSYLRDGITQWVNGWKKSGWIKKTGGEVQYRNLWQYLDRLAAARKVQWTLVKSTNRPTPMAALDSALQEAVNTAKGMSPPPDEPAFEG
ncbi:MAG: RNase H family protein [Chloroflexota bacterium]